MRGVLGYVEKAMQQVSGCAEGDVGDAAERFGRKRHATRVALNDLVVGVTIANGVAYVVSVDGALYALDAAGRRSCAPSGATVKCSPLVALSTGKIADGSPAVVNGVVYTNVTGNVRQVSQP